MTAPGDTGAGAVHPTVEVCDFAGHEWLPAGGGLLICGQCQSEKWDDDSEGDER